MQIIGRVTADATVSETKAGKKVVNFSIAINDTYKTKGSDEVQKIVTYVNCSYWINPGVATYITKGTLVECAGRIGANAWTNKEGEVKASLTFHINSIKLHGRSGGGNTTPAPIVPMTTAPAALSAVADDLPFYLTTASRQQRRDAFYFSSKKFTTMAHNINFNEETGKHSFFSVKEKAWHGLGQIVQDYPNSAAALQFAGLDYTVEKRKLYTQRNEYENPQISVPDYFAIVRTDNNVVLGVVGKNYEVVQNIDAFSFFDAIVDGDGIQYETAGALGKGEKIFITAKLPGYIKVGNDDMIEKYLFLTTSHDGFGSIMAAFTPIRIVCNNTLNAALRNCTNSIKIRHTASVKERLDEAHKVMGISNQLSIQLEGIFNQWAKVRITDKEVLKLIQLAMVPNKEVLQNIQNDELDELSTCFKNMCDDVYEYNMSSPSQQYETTKGTVFGAYNAITGYFQNVRNYKDDEAKMKSMLYSGTAQLRTQKAFQLCEGFAKNRFGDFIIN